MIKKNLDANNLVRIAFLVFVAAHFYFEGGLEGVVKGLFVFHCGFVLPWSLARVFFFAIVKIKKNPDFILDKYILLHTLNVIICGVLLYFVPTVIVKAIGMYVVAFFILWSCGLWYVYCRRSNRGRQ